MVAPAYDHLTALVFACVLFVSGVVAVPAISYVNLLCVDQQQLRNVALEALNSMLLGMGCPSDWGSDFANIEKFGLALDESSSFYVLDPEKVGRLSSSNPSGHLDYESVRNLLKLQNYGLNIRIKPLFNATVTRDDTRAHNDLLFNVNVRFDDGRPIPNADVNATILYVLETGNQGQNYFNFTKTPGNRTNELGECTISYMLPSNAWEYIVVLKVTAAGMSIVTVPYHYGFSQIVANASITGDTVKLWIPYGEHPPERVIHNVTLVTAEEVWNYPGVGCGELPRDHMTKGEGFHDWTQDFPGLSYENALFLIFNIWTQEEHGGPKHFVLFAASPMLDIRSGLLQLGPPSTQSVSNAAIKLCRSVEIAGMTYVFELLLWKET